MSAAYQAHTPELTGVSGKIPLTLGSQAWMIRNGSTDIFAVETANGAMHHVMRCKAGTVLFGHDPEPGQKVILLASSGPDAELLPEMAADVRRHAPDWIKALALTIEIQPPAAVGPGELAAAHRRILRILAGRIQNDKHREEEHLRQRAQHVQQQMQSSLARMVGETTGTSMPVHRSIDSIAAVAELVGQSLQVQLNTPTPLPETHEQAIAAIAEASGLRSRRILLSGDWWREEAGPLIGFREGRPVAFLPAAHGRYSLEDPASGVSLPVDGKVARSCDCDAFVLCRTLPGEAVTASHLLRFCLQGCRSDLLRMLFSGLMSALLGLLLPMATAILFTDVIPSSNREQLWILAGVLTISSLCTALFTLASNTALMRIESRAGTALQVALWDRILRLPVRFFRGYNSADLAMRSLGVDEIRTILGGPALTNALASLWAVLQFGLLARFGPALLLPATATIAATFAASIGLGYCQIRRQRTLAEARSRVSTLLMQVLTGMRKVRVAGAEERVYTRWAAKYLLQRNAVRQSRKVDYSMSILVSAAPLAGMAVLLMSAGHFTEAGRFGAGSFLAFNAAFHQLLTAAIQLGSSLVTLAGVVPHYERIRPVLAASLEKHTGKASPGVLSGALEVRQLTFRYSVNGPAVLSDLSFAVKPGEFVAFVGASGSGKSTLLRLLLGFETPESGAVYYDGIDLEQLDKEAVRKQVGAVLQDGRLLAGDLASNILGSSGLSVEAAWEAARIAGLADDIRAMPMGMHTILSSGDANLSGGQRQRLMIARALVSRPKILIFDEATSALDNRTQTEVSRGIEELQATRIVIAHRLSTIRKADRIYVLDQGRIKEVGRFDDLIALSGTFAALAARQME